MTVRYLELGDLIAIASSVLELELDTVFRIVDLGLAESALARPQSSFDGNEFYESVADKAAVLLHGIARNHAFLDGNKRVAVMATLEFLGVNGYELDLKPPSEAYEVIAAVAAGELQLEKFTEWVGARISPSPLDA